MNIEHNHIAEEKGFSVHLRGEGIFGLGAAGGVHQGLHDQRQSGLHPRGARGDIVTNRSAQRPNGLRIKTNTVGRAQTYSDFGNGAIQACKDSLQWFGNI